MNLFSSSEFIYGIIFAGGFLIIGIVIQIIGSITVDWRNHKRKLKYLEAEIIFNKKIEFLMRLSEQIEHQLSIIISVNREFNRNRINQGKIFSLLKKLPLAKNDTEQPFFEGYSLFVNRNMVIDIRSLRSKINAEYLDACIKIFEEKNKKKKKMKIKKLDSEFGKYSAKFNYMIELIKKELRINQS